MVEKKQEKGPPEPTVDGITETDFLRWRNSPVSLMFFNYLRDYRDAVTKDVMDRWFAGTLKLTDEHQIQGRVAMLVEIAGNRDEAGDIVGRVGFGEIAAFYARPESEGDETEAAEGHSRPV